MRLISFRPNAAITIAGIACGNTFTIKPGDGSFKGWRAYVRGPRIYLLSPKGYTPGKHPTGKGPRTIYDIPREICTICWEGDEEDIEQMAKWSPPAEEVREAPLRVADVEGANPSAQEATPTHTPPAAVQPTSDDEEPDDAPPPEWGGKKKGKGK